MKNQKRKSKRRRHTLVVTMMSLVLLCYVTPTVSANEGGNLGNSQTSDGASLPMPMAVDPDDVDLTDKDTSVVKIDKSQNRYELPANTAFVVLKQGKGTIAIWSNKPVTDEAMKHQLLEN